jgi:hypothetical protein
MRVGLLTLAVTLAGFVCFGVGDVSARQTPRGGAFNAARDCIRPLYPFDADDPFQDVLSGDPRLATFADQCGALANDPRHGGVDAVRARFHAGRANRMNNNLDVAIRQLEGAVAVGADTSAFGPEENRLAMLELVHAYWQANLLDQAQARLDDGLNRTRVLTSNDAAVAYQQAMLDLARSGLSARARAFNTLQTWFPGDAHDLRRRGLSDEDIQSARSWLFRLSVDLGRAELTDARDLTQRLSEGRDGVSFFGAATRTVEIACPHPRDPGDRCKGIRRPMAPANGLDPASPQMNASDEIAYAFFGLGVSELRAAGVADADSAHLAEPGGLDCLNGALQTDAPSRVAAARTAFDTIQYYSSNTGPAHWGLGCALLAGLDPNTVSSQELEQAIALLSNPPPSSVNMMVTLASAQAMAGRGGEARNNLRRALSMPGIDNKRQGEILIAIARTYYHQGSGQRVDPDLFVRTVSDIDDAHLNDLQQPEVRGSLDQAARLGNIEAELVEANIALRSGKYDVACPQLRGIVADNSLDDRAVGVGPYLLSRCLTMSEQAELANGRRRAPRTMSNSDAVRYAVQAFRLQNAHAAAYRLQACAAQITFGDVRGSEEYCAGGANPDGRDSLFQGMYWLRRGIGERHPYREQSLTRAMQAFVQGNDTSGDQTYDYQDLRDMQSTSVGLIDLNRYGATFVQVCVGLDFVHQGDPTSRQVFLQSGIPTC